MGWDGVTFRLMTLSLRALGIEEIGSLGAGRMWSLWAESPMGSADSEEGQGKAGSGEHCGPVQLRCCA